MLLLATQAEPQMLHFAHPNLGRLVQPCHYPRLADTARRGVPWAADNDAFGGFGEERLLGRDRMRLDRRQRLLRSTSEAHEFLSPE